LGSLLPITGRASGLAGGVSINASSGLSGGTTTLCEEDWNEGGNLRA
jgi:hypothetical protein